MAIACVASLPMPAAAVHERPFELCRPVGPQVFDAAESGDAAAQVAVAEMLETCPPADPATALTYFHRAARQGNADAVYALGRRYLLGLGVERDRQEAYFWLRLAAKAQELSDRQREAAATEAERLGPGFTEQQRADLDHRLATWTPERERP